MRLLLLSAFLTTILLLPYKTSGQEFFPQPTQNEISQEGTDSVALLPFPVMGITKEFGITSRLLQEAGEKHLPKEELSEFTSELDTLISQINLFQGDSIIYSLANVSSRELDQISQRAQYFMNEIDGLQDRLSRIASELEEYTALLSVNRQRWQLTLDQRADDEALDARVDLINRTLEGIDSVRNLLQNDLVFILEGQDEFSFKKTELEDLVTRVKAQKVVLGETIFNRDVPGFFKDLSGLFKNNLSRSHWKEFKRSYRGDLALLKSGYKPGIIKTFVMLLALLAFMFWFRKNHSRLIAEDKFELSKLHLVIINSPVVSSLFFMAMMVRLLMPDLPRMFYSINLLVMMIPMAILMVRIYGTVFRTWIIVLVLATSLNLLYELSYHPGVLLRILLLALSLVSIWLFVWIYKRRPYAQLVKHSVVYKFLRILVVVFLAQQVLAIIANLVGLFQLAEVLALIPLQMAVVAIAIQLATKLAETIIYLTLASNYFQKLNVVREEFQVIYKKSTWLTHFFLLLLFLSILLNILTIKDLVFDWGRGVLTDGIKIGAVTISLGSILIFVFVIWLSIMISRIVSQILEKDVFIRVKVAKGIPGTVILMLKTILITGGFFLAAAASGMHLTNLSIVLGAFSVGIGFGLQNIFNNLVSGLILAFERPISIGDVVQVGPLMGTVLSIGLRSS
ncbi:MAG: mechanosensitive ion channel, partial [Bacteroidales bacterium]|nr:mechanosensitive ion channel [Bacteroidales bacterium]